MSQSFKTAEYVSPEHPDKLCDRIADALLDAHIAIDPHARTAIEVMGGHGCVYITGEVTSRATVDVRAIVERIAGTGLEIIENIVMQSPEIAAGVDTGGAGDQGVMIGYATSETPELLPIELVLARDLNRFLYERWPHDGKTQVTLRGGEIVAIVASFQHAAHDELMAAVTDWMKTREYVAAGTSGIDASELHINPAGDWDMGGFDADAGLTGRKLIVDNYGPRIPIGGGAYSGKDPSKVDRSAAYMARKIAVDYLRRFRADEVFVRLAYAIGRSQPVEATVMIDGKEQRVEGYDLSPHGIAEVLQLRRPIYEDLATSGHYGRQVLAWEG